MQKVLYSTPFTAFRAQKLFGKLNVVYGMNLSNVFCACICYKCLNFRFLRKIIAEKFAQ
jgi:hypothetical protein